MDDDRIWQLEESLWTGDPHHYRELIDIAALFVVPARPFALSGSDAADAMGTTPRWDKVSFSDQQVARPQEGLIVIAYHALASGAGNPDYAAHCTTTLRRLSHEDWRVVQHQQTPPLVASA